MAWYNVKDAIANAIGISHDVLHVHFGMGVFVVAAALFSRSHRWPAYACLAVVSLELANEVLDAADWIGWTGHVNWGETGRDISNTIFWPTVLMAWIYVRRRLPLGTQGEESRTNS